MAKIPIRSTASAEGFATAFSELDATAFPEVSLPVSAAVPTAPPKKKHRVVLQREKARRGGKVVVIVSHLPTHLSPPELDSLLKRTRKALGCGGQLVGRDLEIQGDQLDRISTFLEKEGFATN